MTPATLAPRLRATSTGLAPPWNPQHLRLSHLPLPWTPPSPESRPLLTLPEIAPGPAPCFRPRLLSVSSPPNSWRDLFKTRVRRHPSPAPRPPVAAVLLGGKAAVFATTHTAPLTWPHCHAGSCPATLPLVCSAWAAHASPGAAHTPGEFQTQGLCTWLFLLPSVLSTRSLLGSPSHFL